MHAQLLSHVWLFATPWIAACQASLSITVSQSLLKHVSIEWYHSTISSPVVPFSSCLQSFLASESFPMSQRFTSGGQNTGVSFSAAVLPMNIQNFTFTTSHIHNWVSFLLWPSHFILSGALFPLFPSSILDTCQPGGSSSCVMPFCFFILFMGFSRQGYWSSS